MGYYMTQHEADFYIDSRDFPDMIKAIHELVNHPEKMGGSSFNGNLDKRHYSWVDMSFVNTSDVKKIFNCWRWSITQDKHGNIIDIIFEGEKLGDDFYLFQAIAPFVTQDSFIEMHGEDNQMWRWKFINGKCEEITPTISWED